MEAKQVSYQASTITREILHIYRLPNTESNQDDIRKKVESICRNTKVTVGNQEIDLWTKSEKPCGRQKRHYFTYEERQKIITSDELRKYIIKNKCDSVIAQAYSEATKEAEKANEAYREFLETVDYDEVRHQEEYGISWAEVRQKKFEMMIEALFIKTFGSPIDIDELRMDMEISSMGGGEDNTPESVMAANRLKDVKNYLAKDKQ